MPHHITFEFACGVVLSRDALERERWRDRDIARCLADGTLHRLQRNRYVLQADWADLWPESRHRVEVAAAVQEMRHGDAVLSHQSAAVLWDLPLYRHIPAAVHVSVAPGKHVSSRPGLVRHHGALSVDDVTMRHGVRVTTLERTVFDLARTLDFDAAVALADAALRRVAMSDGRYDSAAAERWRDSLLLRARRSAGARGVRQAIEVIRFADGRAESPAESVARVRLAALGFQHIALQVTVTGPRGKVYRADMELEDIGVFVEVDGLAKYRDEALRSGRALDDLLLDEKRREDWIRGTTQKRLVRVEEAHLRTVDALARRLASFGVVPPFVPPRLPSRRASPPAE